jgi:hypothetical protein
LVDGGCRHDYGFLFVHLFDGVVMEW